MTTYKELDAKLTGRNATRRKLGPHTYAERRDGGAIAVKLHATDVLTFYKDGRVVLNTGGWKTRTTADRINAYLPHGYRIASVKNTWYVYKGDTRVAVYADGLTIGPRGKLSGAGPKDAAQQDKYTRAIVHAYAIGFLTALENGHVGLPGPGDCFYCAMRDVKTGAPLGEATHNADHIREHIREEYYVPSLLVRALETFGASPVCRAYVWARMSVPPFASEDEANKMGVYSGIGREQAEKMLRRYVCRQLGMAG